MAAGRPNLGVASPCPPRLRPSCPHQAMALLLKHGADPNLADDDGRTALMIASQHGDGSSVKLLLAAGAGFDMDVQFHSLFSTA